MSKKNVSIVVEYNTIWFRHVQPRTERKPRATPFYKVSFGSCTVPFHFVRYCARSPSAAFFAEQSQARWNAFRFPDALSCSRPPPHDKEKPWDAFFKSWRSPQIANHSRVRRSLLAQSRRINEMKRNDKLGKTERYSHGKQTKRTVITVLWNGTAQYFDSYCTAHAQFAKGLHFSAFHLFGYPVLIWVHTFYPVLILGTYTS